MLIDCYSEGVSTLYKDMPLFDNMKFEDRSGKTKLINYNIFIKRNVSRNIYGKEKVYQLIDGKNITIIKWNNWTNVREKWVKYNFEILSAGVYEWRVEGKKEISEDLDWIGTSEGIELRVWAWWDSYDGVFTIYNTTGADTFTVPAGVTNISVLTIAGGGGGGGGAAGTGGTGSGSGAGGMIFNGSYATTPSETINLHVGIGGIGGSSGGQGQTGQFSFFGTTNTTGGGNGTHQDFAADRNGGDGGSGGGAPGTGGGSPYAGGSGIPGQGYDGGANDNSAPYPPGGGGGAGAVGDAGAGSQAGDGGIGRIIWGQCWAGGGGGGESSEGAAFGVGQCGGGDGGNNANGEDGVDGYGSGAGGGYGGSNGYTGGDGGDGIIIVRYIISDLSPVVKQSHPTNLTTYTLTNIVEFSANISDDSGGLDNSSFYLDGNLNRTNSSLVNGSEWNITMIPLSEGTYDWYYDAWDNASQHTIGTGMRFTIDTKPTIHVKSPLNQTYTNPMIWFNFTNSTPTDLWTINYNGTNITKSIANNSLNVEDGFHQLLVYANNSVTGKHGLNDTRSFTVDTTPEINVFSPLNQNYSISTIYFNATSSLSVDQWIVNYNGTNSTLSSINSSLNVEDGTHNLLLYGRNAVSGKYGLNDTRSFTVDTIAPTVYDATNITDLVAYSLPKTSIWGYNVNDPHLDKCYYNTSENVALTLVTCNSSNINTAWASGGNKTIQYFANDTGGLETSKFAYVYVYYITYNQTDNPDPVGEGINVTFDFNVSLTNTPTVTATFRLNNTYYNPDSTTATTNYTYFTKVITIPDTYGNATGFPQLWKWNYTIDGVVTNASTYDTNVTVYELAVDNCSSYGDPILNISLKDEEANTLVNGSAGSTIEIDLRLTSIDDPTILIDYSNTWTNVNESAVCIPSGLLTGSEYQIDFTIGYQATNKVWEFFYLDGGVLNSTKIFDAYTNSTIDLMDLITLDSTSFLFNFFDTDGLPVDNSIVHVFRQYIGEGLFREVERGKADENGDTVIHLVEEDVIYYFLVADNGDTIYTSSTYTALCQTTPCTIVLEASGDSAEFPTDWDLVPDGNFSINSSVTTRGVSVVYNFDTPTDVNFTVYKYENDGSYSSVVTDSDTSSTSGIMTLAVPLSAGNVSFFSTVYVDGEFVTSEWIDFSEKATDHFGQTMSLFLAALLVLTLGLIAVSEGAGVIVFVIIGVFISGALGLINTRLNTGISILVFLIISGGLIIWKLTGGRK